MAANQSGKSGNQNPQSGNPIRNQSTGTQAAHKQQGTLGKKPDQFSDNLAKTLGHRGRFQDDLNDVSLAIGVSVLLSGGANLLLVLLALFIAVREPESAPFILGGASIFDLPSFFHYFISTFPLMFGTATFFILLFAKALGNFFGAVLAFVIIFFVAMWLGGALGISNFDIGAITSNNSAGWYSIPFKIIGAFYNVYGPYRFFVSILTGIVIAWSISIKMFPYLKKKPPEKS